MTAATATGTVARRSLISSSRRWKKIDIVLPTPCRVGSQPERACNRPRPRTRPRVGRVAGGGVTGVHSAMEQEHVEYVTARMPALRRLAHALCGDRHRADDIVQQAITRLYAHWGK